jgi:hypothetical protein
VRWGRECGGECEVDEIPHALAVGLGGRKDEVEVEQPRAVDDVRQFRANEFIAPFVRETKASQRTSLYVCWSRPRFSFSQRDFDMHRTARVHSLRRQLIVQASVTDAV